MYAAKFVTILFFVKLQRFELNTSVAMVFLKRTLQLEGEGKLPPSVSLVLCYLEIKFQKLYPRFSRVSFSTVTMPTFTDDSFTPKFF